MQAGILDLVATPANDHLGFETQLGRSQHLVIGCFRGLHEMKLWLLPSVWISDEIQLHLRTSRWCFQILFYFYPTWGNDPIWLLHIFQVAWNHQLDLYTNVGFMIALGCSSRSCFGSLKVTPIWNLVVAEDQFVELQCCRGGKSGCGQLGTTHAYQDPGRPFPCETIWLGWAEVEI